MDFIFIPAEWLYLDSFKFNPLYLKIQLRGLVYWKIEWFCYLKCEGQ